MKYTRCEKCNKDISNANYKRHVTLCPIIKIKKIRGVDYDPGKGFKDGTRVSWNKGLDAETNESVRVGRDSLRDAYKSGRAVPQINHHSEETKCLMREHAIRRRIGGVRPSKKISYNGKSLGSSYELKVVQSLDQNNIAWDTCSRFIYIDPFGKERTYTPDIYLIDYDIYLDPKK